MSYSPGQPRDAAMRQPESSSPALPFIIAGDWQAASLAIDQRLTPIGPMPDMNYAPGIVRLSPYSNSINQQQLHGPSDMSMSASSPSFYSSSFDITQALAIAQWTLRQTYIGFEPPTAFIAADMTQHDLPIVYASDAFVEMTGYRLDEILGRNCRFLQAPPGSHTGDHVRPSGNHEFKHKIASGLVCQHVLPNYRKDGEMFINYITIIPIIGNNCGSNNLVFGFSVDMTNTATNNFEIISPTESTLLLRRRDLMAELESRASYPDSTKLSTATRSIAHDSPENDPRLLEPSTFPARTTVPAIPDELGGVPDWPPPQDLHKLALDQSSGLILIVNLRGQIQYVSQLACTADLGYDPDNIVGQRLQDMCHPADSGLITRRISSAPVGSLAYNDGDVLFRLRHSNGSHVWYSCAAKGFQQDRRKFVMLSGWIQPAPSLSRRLVVGTGGGFGDRDLWLRITSSGLVLALLSPVPLVLGLSESDMVATTFQDRINDTQVDDFLKMLARSKGNVAVSGTFKLKTPMTYDLQASIAIYPDASLSSQRTPFSAILHCRPTKAVRGAVRTTAAVTARSSQSGTCGTANTTSALPTDTSAPGRIRDNADDADDIDADHDDDELVTPKVTTTTDIMTTRAPDGFHKAKPITYQWTPTDTTNTHDHDDHDNHGNHDSNDDDDIMKHNNGPASTNTCKPALAGLYSLQAENTSLRSELEQLENFSRHRRRLKTLSHAFRGCANCHTRVSPEWRRGPSGKRDLCNRCGLRWAKLNGGGGAKAHNNNHGVAGDGAAVAAKSSMQRGRKGPRGNRQVQPQLIQTVGAVDGGMKEEGEDTVRGNGVRDGLGIEGKASEGGSTTSGKRLRDDKEGCCPTEDVSKAAKTSQ